MDAMLERFDAIQLTQVQIDEAIEFIAASESEETAVLKIEEARLKRQLNILQERISKLVDMHVDGVIDAHMYHMKLAEYQKEKNDIAAQLKSYDVNGLSQSVTAREVLQLAQRAREIFESSRLDEKQQLLRFFFELAV